MDDKGAVEATNTGIANRTNNHDTIYFTVPFKLSSF